MLRHVTAIMAELSRARGAHGRKEQGVYPPERGRPQGGGKPSWALRRSRSTGEKTPKEGMCGEETSSERGDPGFRGPVTRGHAAHRGQAAEVGREDHIEGQPQGTAPECGLVWVCGQLEEFRSSELPLERPSCPRLMVEAGEEGWDVQARG